MELSPPSRLIGARSDNWAEVDVTATAADYDGESSVKTCFALSLSPRSALTQTNAATQLGGRNGFLVVHVIDRHLSRVEMGRRVATAFIRRNWLYDALPSARGMAA